MYIKWNKFHILKTSTPFYFITDMELKSNIADEKRIRTPPLPSIYTKYLSTSLIFTIIEVRLPATSLRVLLKSNVIKQYIFQVENQYLILYHEYINILVSLKGGGEKRLSNYQTLIKQVPGMRNE